MPGFTALHFKGHLNVNALKSMVAPLLGRTTILPAFKIRRLMHSPHIQKLVLQTAAGTCQRLVCCWLAVDMLTNPRPA
eukprot:scaffold293560_cov17-Tisochrysis_lutea.AAC.1